MKSNKKTARIIGVLLLLQFIIGVLIHQFLLGPIIFVSEFLTNVAANSTQVIIAVLIGLIGSAISVGIAVILLPIFRKYSPGLALWYLGFSIIGFTISVVDNLSALSVLSLSQEYVKSGAANTDYFQIFGDVLYATRWWTHYLDMLVAFFALPVFYYILFMSKLIPRFISAWGGIAVVLMLTGIMLTIFDKATHGTEMILLLPLGLNRLFLSAWLMIKGFNSSIIFSQSTNMAKAEYNF